jgi:hypothetical protein
MTAARDLYTREMHKKFGYFATWAPTVPLRLGDIGVLRKHDFRRVTTLAEKSIPFQVRRDASPSDLQYTSSNGVSFHFKVAGDAPVPGSTLRPTDAGVSIHFQRANAIVFQALECRASSILDQEGLGKALMARVASGEREWEHYVVLTEIIEAKGATILISSGGGAVIDLAATAGVGYPRIADVDAHIQIVHCSNLATKVVAAARITPLFKACALKRRGLLRRRLDLEARGGQPGHMLPTNALPTNEPDLCDLHFGELTFEETGAVECR